MTPSLESVDKPILGELYIVRVAVLSIPLYGHTVLPIDGPWHEDRDIIRFEYDHFHIDWRFAPTGFIAKIMADGRYTEQAVVITNRYVTPGRKIVPRTLREEVRGMRMLREWKLFPKPGHVGELGTAPWLDRLQDSMKSQQMKCLTCPHRGFSLKGAPVIEGIAICPGHGLAWNLTTGKVVPRPLTAEVGR